MKKKWITWAASVAACGMPLIHYLYVVMFWLLASATLGHWAQPGVNDPKGFFFGVPGNVGILLMLLSVAVVPVVVFLGYRQRKTLIYVLTYGACFVVSVVLFRADIHHITTWIAD